MAQELLGANIAVIVMRLEEFKKPLIEIDGKSVVINIDGELSGPRNEAELKEFLEIAESIVNTVVRY